MKYPGDEIKVISGWEIILNRPAMYLGKKSIYGLRCLIEGIKVANYANPHAKDVFEVDWWEFEKWVMDKTKTKNYSRSFDVALKLSNELPDGRSVGGSKIDYDPDGPDERAFDLWAEWFREFKAQKA